MTSRGGDWETVVTCAALGEEGAGGSIILERFVKGNVAPGWVQPTVVEWRVYTALKSDQGTLRRGRYFWVGDA